MVVGSAKLGFSIAPDKRYRHFGEHSDIDIVLTSGLLFDSLWQDVFDSEQMGTTWDNATRFKKYLFRGWIRPDLLPPPGALPRAREWWDYFQALSASQEFGPIRIRGALFRSWYFLERYHERTVGSCRTQMAGTT